MATSIFCRRLRAWFPLLVGLCVCVTASADIFSYVDDDGVRHFSNVPNNPKYRRVMRTEGEPSVKPPGIYRVAYPGKPYLGTAKNSGRNRFSLVVEHIAREVRLDPALIEAVIKAESAFNPEAESHAGAVGLMQLMPATARRYGVLDRRDPIQNMKGGARYLRDLIDEFRRLPLALAAYNAGEAAVRRYGNAIPPYAETQTYVKRVQAFYRDYRARRAGRDS